MYSAPLAWSVIIPTLNRCKNLERSLQALVRQNLHSMQYEILVVDNGSTDATENLVRQCMAEHPQRQIRFLKTSPQGLLSGRQYGATESRGRILTFVDDDIDVAPDYGTAILQAFHDHPQAALVGGPCRPHFAIEPPAWVEHYCQRRSGYFCCGPLSLHDMGNRPQEMDPQYVWGLNFSIRKDILFSAGGFHPDNVPKQFQIFQGDGETGLARALVAKNFTAHYAPQACVTHITPAERLTEEYFCNRFFYQGVCDSYTEIRSKGHTHNLHVPLLQKVNGDDDTQALHARIHNAYVDGYLFHQHAVKSSPRLMAWVMKEDYWDYAYPELETGLEFPRQWVDALWRDPLKTLGDVTQTLALACRYAEKQDIVQALRVTSSVERQYPQLADAKMVRCLVLEHAGKLEEATHAAQEALQLDEQCVDAQAFLRRVQSPVGGALLTETYDLDFYTEDGDLSARSARRVLPQVMQLLQPQSVQDFGCGQGDWLAVFTSLGVQTILGYDANALHAADLLIPAGNARQCCDFTSTDFGPEIRSDLVMSLEVAEHLPHESAAHFVHVLTQAAPCVLFSAALPCQTGVRHLNERPLKYWKTIFQQHGYVLFDVLRPLFMYDSQIAWWYRQNIVLFISAEYLQTNQTLYKKLQSMLPCYPMNPVYEDNIMRLCQSHDAVKKIDTAVLHFMQNNNSELFLHSIVTALQESGDPESLQSLCILQQKKPQ